MKGSIIEYGQVINILAQFKLDNPGIRILCVSGVGIRPMTSTPLFHTEMADWNKVIYDLILARANQPLILVASAQDIPDVSHKIRGKLGTTAIRITVGSFKDFLRMYGAPNTSDPSLHPEEHLDMVVATREQTPAVRSELGLNDENIDLIEIVTAKAGAGQDVAFVQLRAKIGDVTFFVEGAARRDPRDSPDPELGLTLATARALGSLATKIERRATGRIKHNEDTLEIQAGQRAQRQRRGADAKALGLARAAARRERAQAAEKLERKAAKRQGEHGHTVDREG